MMLHSNCPSSSSSSSSSTSSTSSFNPCAAMGLAKVCSGPSPPPAPATAMNEGLCSSNASSSLPLATETEAVWVEENLSPQHSIDPAIKVVMPETSVVEIEVVAFEEVHEDLLHEESAPGVQEQNVLGDEAQEEAPEWTQFDVAREELGWTGVIVDDVFHPMDDVYYPMDDVYYPMDDVYYPMDDVYYPTDEALYPMEEQEVDPGVQVDVDAQGGESVGLEHAEGTYDAYYGTFTSYSMPSYYTASEEDQSNTYMESTEYYGPEDSITPSNPVASYMAMYPDDGADYTNQAYGADCTDQAYGAECTNQAYGADCTNQAYGADCTNQGYGADCTNQAYGPSTLCHQTSTCDAGVAKSLYCSYDYCMA